MTKWFRPTNEELEFLHKCVQKAKDLTIPVITEAFNYKFNKNVSTDQISHRVGQLLGEQLYKKLFYNHWNKKFRVKKLKIAAIEQWKRKHDEMTIAIRNAMNSMTLEQKERQRNKVSEAITRLYNDLSSPYDEVFQKKRIEILRTPKVRQQTRETILQLYENDPTYKNRISEGVIENRKTWSEEKLNSWKKTHDKTIRDPTVRMKISESITRAYEKNPEILVKQQESRKLVKFNVDHMGFVNRFGEHFRSRIEVECSEYLHELELQFEYENISIPYHHKGYTTYGRNDFYILQFNLNIEIVNCKTFDSDYGRRLEQKLLYLKSIGVKILLAHNLSELKQKLRKEGEKWIATVRKC